MSRYFEEAFQKTLGYEGGLSNDANDKGGLTKYGISQASYPKVDIRNLTLDQAKAIYKSDFWDACRCGEINDKNIAMQVFDMAVNHGTGGAGKLVQKAVNNLAGKEALIIDGAIGKLTIQAVNYLEPKKLNNNIVRYRARFYAQICTKNTSQVCFLEGWLNRCMGYIY